MGWFLRAAIVGCGVVGGVCVLAGVYIGWAIFVVETFPFHVAIPISIAPFVVAASVSIAWLYLEATK